MPKALLEWTCKNRDEGGAEATGTIEFVKPYLQRIKLRLLLRPKQEDIEKLKLETEQAIERAKQFQEETKEIQEDLIELGWMSKEETIQSEKAREAPKGTLWTKNPNDVLKDAEDRLKQAEERLGRAQTEGAQARADKDEEMAVYKMVVGDDNFLRAIRDLGSEPKEVRKSAIKTLKQEYPEAVKKKGGLPEDGD